MGQIQLWIHSIWATRLLEVVGWDKGPASEFRALMDVAISSRQVSKGWLSPIHPEANFPIAITNSAANGCVAHILALPPLSALLLPHAGAALTSCSIPELELLPPNAPG